MVRAIVTACAHTHGIPHTCVAPFYNPRDVHIYSDTEGYHVVTLSGLACMPKYRCAPPVRSMLGAKYYNQETRLRISQDGLRRHPHKEQCQQDEYLRARCSSKTNCGPSRPLSSLLLEVHHDRSASSQRASLTAFNPGASWSQLRLTAKHCTVFPPHRQHRSPAASTPVATFSY